jgi:transcriptional regulator with XRE-family HTH domain
MFGRMKEPALGAVIRHERLKRKIRQNALAKRSGVDQGNISRIERCIVAEPTQDTLRKLAKGLRLDDPDFFVKHQQRLVHAPPRLSGVHTLPETLNVGFGLCSWTAPLIALFDSVPPGIRFAGYDRIGERSNTEWIDGNVCPRWWEMSPEVGEQKATRWSAIRFYSDFELLSLLKKGQFDCIVSPRGYYEADPEILKCAEILVVRQHPEVALFLNDAQLRDLDCSALSFDDAWTAFVGIGDAPIFYDREEVAEGIVKQMTNVLPESEIRRLRDLRLGAFDDVLAEIDAFIANGQSFAFVGWLHYIEWLIERSNLSGTGFTCKRAASSAFPSEARDEETYSSMDLVFLRDRITQWLGNPKVQNLLDALEVSTKQLRRAGGPPTGVLRKLSEYFQIPYQQCAQEIRRLKFELKIDPAWYRRMFQHAYPNDGSSPDGLSLPNK